MKRYVVDTSVVIEKIVTKLAKENKIEGDILIPNAVVSELEGQANRGQEIGFIGLEEIQEIRKFEKLTIHFVGNRPTDHQIKYAKSGEIDSYIRELARENDAILITGDKVQAESGKAFGIEVIYIERKPAKSKLTIEEFFDDQTMSLHLVANCYPYGKKGKPGDWKLTKLSDKKISAAEMEEIEKEILEKARVDEETFMEISRKSMTVVQYRNYRIVSVKPPVADDHEITVVKPLIKLNLEDYKLEEKLLNRVKEKARGIIIAGEPGSGKSTFAQALTEEYLKLGRVIKTVESPRDLVLPPEITQYSKNYASSETIHDILFLSRPDNVLFDEMRDTPDFNLYVDLRLGGSECMGVIHSASPIDAVQRFITRMEVGMIPSVVDTILFIEKGTVKAALGLGMVVKTPSGMTEADLARPVVEVRDFVTGKLTHEIYSYGEQTVIIPVTEEAKVSGLKGLAEKEVKRYLGKYVSECEVEFLSDNRVAIYVPENEIARLIGTKGKTIMEVEEKLGISIDVRELEVEKNSIQFDISEDKTHVRLYVDPGLTVDLFIDEKFVTTAIASKKGEIKISKQSQLGRDLLKAMNSNKKIELRA
ncbi:MAG: PINc/VapC family ATPase [Candidatus Nanoarchaeia archaeon]|nr:PINc/VapC family ATPase [Candidatus Nanoarchaeia archaeon]